VKNQNEEQSIKQSIKQSEVIIPFVLVGSRFYDFPSPFFSSSINPLIHKSEKICIEY